MQWKLEAACVSDIGQMRGNNEDNLYFQGRILPLDHVGTGKVLCSVGTAKKGTVSCLAVFDGMGGEAFGEQASFLAAETMQKAMNHYAGQPPENYLSEVCRRMNQKICEAAVQNRCKRMGTTAAILFFVDTEVYCCNLGDSRIFMVQNGAMRQISVDHTNEASMKLLGVTGRKPQLTQHLGIPEEDMLIAPSISKYGLQQGTQFLICSDGLTDMVSMKEIAYEVAHNNAETVCRHLVNSANHAGGKDNITMIVCTVMEEALQSVPKKQAQAVCTAAVPAVNQRQPMQPSSASLPSKAPTTRKRQAPAHQKRQLKGILPLVVGLVLGTALGFGVKSILSAQTPQIAALSSSSTTSAALPEEQETIPAQSALSSSESEQILPSVESEQILPSAESEQVQPSTESEGEAEIGSNTPVMVSRTYQLDQRRVTISFLDTMVLTSFWYSSATDEAEWQYTQETNNPLVLHLYTDGILSPDMWVDTFIRTTGSTEGQPEDISEQIGMSGYIATTADGTYAAWQLETGEVMTLKCATKEEAIDYSLQIVLTEQAE